MRTAVFGVLACWWMRRSITSCCWTTAAKLVDADNVFRNLITCTKRFMLVSAKTIVTQTDACKR